MKEIQYTTGKCYYCGAELGIHKSETLNCPKDGKEEMRWDDLNNRYYPQQWNRTTFEDSGIKKIELASFEMLTSLISCNKRLEEYKKKNGDIGGRLTDCMIENLLAIKKATE